MAYSRGPCPCCAAEMIAGTAAASRMPPKGAVDNQLKSRSENGVQLPTSEWCSGDQGDGAFRFAAGGGLFAGVGAEQVIHAVAVRARGLDQAGAGQSLERTSGLLRGGASQDRDRVGLKAGTGVQGRQAEGAGGGGGQ